MTPSSCSHPSRNLFPRAATPRAECFSILDQRSRARRIVLGRIEADDDQILRADQPSLHKSLCSRRLSSPRFSPFIIARPATTSGLRRNEDRKSLAWTEGEGMCDRGNEEERFPFTPPPRERYAARMDGGESETMCRGKYYRGAYRAEGWDWRASLLSLGTIKYFNREEFPLDEN